MTDYEYIIIQVKKFHFSKWDESKRKKLDADKTEVCLDKETPIDKEL